MSDSYDWGEDPTAQDVIDALRIAVLAQDDPVKVERLVRCLIEFAPETDRVRGMGLLMRLLSEATLAVSVTDPAMTCPAPTPSIGANEQTKS